MTDSYDTNLKVAPAVKLIDGGILLSVHIQPGAKSSRFVGLIENRLKIAVTARAQDGAANEALLHLLAKTLGLAKANVSLLKGLQSRQKTILISGLKNQADRERMILRLNSLISEPPCA